MREHSVIHFKRQVDAEIEAGQWHTALRTIQLLVDQVFCEPLNTARIFSSEMLDEYCQKIGRQNLQKLGLKPYDSAEVRAVYIASRLQASGGHTAALADMIRLSPIKDNIILITGTVGATDINALRSRFEHIDVRFEYAPLSNHAEKLSWLQQQLNVLKPSDVWLFNHHQDSVAIAAVQPDQGYRLHFFHHGDHHLCLGVHLVYADHIDPHPMGLAHCRDQLGIQSNRYLPLIAPDKGMRSDDTDFMRGWPLKTCTAAGHNKLEIPYFISYPELLPELLNATGGTHVHIGRLSPWMLWRIRRNLKASGIVSERFQYMRYVPSVWESLQQHKIDYYIASFPYGGGRTLIEAMGSGTPVAVHSHSDTRMLGGTDMAYEGALLWRDPEELLSYLKRLDSEQLSAESKKARARYERYHQESVLKSVLYNSSAIIEPPALYPYMPDQLQTALHISNSMTIERIFLRFLRKFIRRLRS